MSIQKYATGQLIHDDEPGEPLPAPTASQTPAAAGCGRCGGRCGCPPPDDGAEGE